MKDDILKAAENTIGAKGRNERNDWFDEECEAELRARNEARIKMLSQKTREMQELYKSARREAKKVIRRKKKKILENKLENIENFRYGGNQKHSFKRLNNIRQDLNHIVT